MATKIMRKVKIRIWNIKDIFKKIINEINSLKGILFPNS